MTLHARRLCRPLVMAFALGLVLALAGAAHATPPPCENICTCNGFCNSKCTWYDLVTTCEEFGKCKGLCRRNAAPGAFEALFGVAMPTIEKRTCDAGAGTMLAAHAVSPRTLR